MEIKIAEYEKLGVFYLGREYDVGRRRLDEGLVLYDSKDLVTHGVVLGMTGSGKTGLCLALIEEAAMDGVPAILIDPKGDLPNLLLTFPDLDPGDFRPWINEGDAQRMGQTPDQFAETQADRWKKGLAEWGQSGERIRALREKVEMAVYTPGSNAGIPVSILSSFQAPPAEMIDDGEVFGERIESTVSSLLALVGIDADPIKSREHILLSNILSARWRKGEALSLARLIEDIQTPPFGEVGVVDVETFFPEKKRTEFAMAINSLLAAPGFQTWMQGVPLDIQSILHTPSGKPRIAIFSIAHLGDAERMFFVSLLLNQVVGWMRAQSGTTSLRALLYMDEIYGFLPPTANPPSKKPMLILFKQARAFGVGVLLATQNPVDLDYKALANAGTWWLGRLQTERDKARVLEGLEGAAAGQHQKFERAQVEQLLAGLDNRIFLMNNVHEDAPVVFQVRWCMSYLRGPLTRSQIKMLMDPERANYISTGPPAGARTPEVARPAAARSREENIASQSSSRQAGSDSAFSAKPAVSKNVTEFFLAASSANPNAFPVVFVPHLLEAAEILFSDPKKGISGKKKVLLLAEVGTNQTSFDTSNPVRLDKGLEIFERDPITGEYQPLPAFALQGRSYTAARNVFLEYCYANEGLEILYCAALDAWSKPGESEGDFRTRLTQQAREERDRAVEDLRRTYAKKAAPIEERLRRTEAAVDREKQQSHGAWMQTAVSVGAGVLGALFGRKVMGSGTLGRGATAARAAGRAWQQQGDIGRAKESVGAVQQQLDALEAELKIEIDKLHLNYDLAKAPFQTSKISPLKKNIIITGVGLAWLPFFRVSSTSLEPAWD
ncbi:MAG: ATP-binding protein [Verrucomicrobiales bacterium]